MWRVLVIPRQRCTWMSSLPIKWGTKAHKLTILIVVLLVYMSILTAFLIFDIYMIPWIFHFTCLPLWPLYLFQTKGSLHIFKEKGSFPAQIYPKSQPLHMNHSTSRLVLYAVFWTPFQIWPPVTRYFMVFFIHYHIWHEVSKASYNEPGSTGHSWALKEMIQGDVIRVVDKGQ